jgi:hypothetical protein
MKKSIYLKVIYLSIFIFFGIAITQFIVNIYKSKYCIYIPTTKNSDRYHYLIKSSSKNDLKLLISGGRRDKGWIYTYDYKDQYRITIWEIFGFNHLNLDDFILLQRINPLERQKSYQNIEVGKNPEINLKFKTCMDLSNKVKIVFAADSGLCDSLNLMKYISFCGKTRKILFINESNEQQINVSFGKKAVPVDLVIYKKANSLFLILITGIGPQNDIPQPNQILNLK